jgi:ankyrin repeat protein
MKQSREARIMLSNSREYIQEYINKPNKEGKTPLTYMIENEQDGMLDTILENKSFDIKVTEKDLKALEKTDIRDSIKLLIKEKLKQIRLNNFLIKAIKEKKIYEVEEWLNKGADPNSKDQEGHPALYMVALGSIDDPEMAKILIDKGADVNAVMQEGYDLDTALHAAIDWGNDEVAKLLIPKADLSIQDVDGHTALSLAIEKNKVELVKLCINNRANVNITIGDESLLTYSLKEGYEEVAKALLASKDLKITEEDLEAYKESGMKLFALKQKLGNSNQIEKS